jgi:hypothetical protein
MIDGDRSVLGHNTKQLRLVTSLPAADAGANRRGHRNRLTRRSLLLPRATFACQDSSQVLAQPLLCVLGMLRALHAFLS